MAFCWFTSNELDNNIDLYSLPWFILYHMHVERHIVKLLGDYWRVLGSLFLFTLQHFIFEFCSDYNGENIIMKH